MQQEIGDDLLPSHLLSRAHKAVGKDRELYGVQLHSNLPALLSAYKDTHIAPGRDHSHAVWLHQDGAIKSNTFTRNKVKALSCN